MRQYLAQVVIVVGLILIAVSPIMVLVLSNQGVK